MVNSELPCGTRFRVFWENVKIGLNIIFQNVRYNINKQTRILLEIYMKMQKAMLAIRIIMHHYSEIIFVQDNSQTKILRFHF